MTVRAAAAPLPREPHPERRRHGHRVAGSFHPLGKCEWVSRGAGQCRFLSSHWCNLILWLASTREARAAQERLPDRISIGVLARTFPMSVLDEAIEAAGVRELRYRRLPARLMIVFTLACWLFMRSGYGLVLSKLADAQALVGAGWGDWQVPWTGSITKAKAKIGAEPFRLLFAPTAVPAGTVDTPALFYAGLRVVTVDGFTLDLPDTDENAEFFGRGGNGSESKNPYPQLRALALAESGTRVLLATTYGPSGVGEQTLAEDLLPALGPGMLVFWPTGTSPPSSSLAGRRRDRGAAGLADVGLVQTARAEG